jgi:hypothetical protein
MAPILASMVMCGGKHFQVTKCVFSPLCVARQPMTTAKSALVCNQVAAPMVPLLAGMVLCGARLKQMTRFVYPQKLALKPSEIIVGQKVVIYGIINCRL